MKDILSELYRQAYSHNNNECGIIDKSFSIEDWVRLVFGKAKFHCLEHKFPTMDLWDGLDKQFGMEKHRIWINKNGASITFEGNEDKCLLVGDVDYSVVCNRLRPYHIICMHGAKVTINGSGRAVLFVETDGTCEINEELTDGAIIIHK
jgi:hypothetical protein